VGKITVVSTISTIEMTTYEFPYERIVPIGSTILVYHYQNSLVLELRTESGVWITSPLIFEAFSYLDNPSLLELPPLKYSTKLNMGVLLTDITTPNSTFLAGTPVYACLAIGCILLFTEDNIYIHSFGQNQPFSGDHINMLAAGLANGYFSDDEEQHFYIGPLSLYVHQKYIFAAKLIS